MELMQVIRLILWCQLHFKVLLMFISIDCNLFYIVKSDEYSSDLQKAVIAVPKQVEVILIVQTGDFHLRILLELTDLLEIL